jgi:hypothetical protein
MSEPEVYRVPVFYSIYFLSRTPVTALNKGEEPKKLGRHPTKRGTITLATPSPSPIDRTHAQ